MHYNYKILLTKEVGGCYVVTVPALAGCITQGDNIDEVLAMGKEANEMYIEELQSSGEPILDNSNTLEYSLNL